MATAVIYARVSSTGERQSTSRQVADLTNYASLNGIEVVEVYEEHISGAKRNEERAVLTECINYAVNNRIDVVLFLGVESLRSCSMGGVRYYSHIEG